MDTITPPKQPEEQPQSPSPHANIPQSAETPLIGWETPEFIQYKKNRLWFIIAIAIFIILVIFAAVTRQWLMAAVIVLVGVVIYIFTQQKPKTVSFSISHAGISFGERFYPYSEIKSFWVVYEPTIRTLNFELTRRFSTIITIQLLEQDPLPIRKFLKKYLPEEKSRGEDINDRISRFLRF